MAALTDITARVDTTRARSAARARFRRGRRLLAAAPELAGLALCAVLFARTGALHTGAGGPGPAFFPRLVLLLVAVGLGVVITQRLRVRPDAGIPADSTADAADGAAAAEIGWPRFAVGVALSVGYVVATHQLGWPIATAAFIVAFIHLAGRHNPLVTVPFALLVSVTMTYVFIAIVYVSLPTGVGVFDTLTDHLLVALGVY